MTADPDTVRGVEMTRETAGEILSREGYGVLSLADDGIAHSLPMSFGYDGDRLYFVFLQSTADSRKAWYAERTARASFTVVAARGKHDWESVVVSGPLDPVEDDEWPAMRAALEDNAWFPSLFSEAEPMTDVRGWSLLIESISGRRSR